MPRTPFALFLTLALVLSLTACKPRAASEQPASPAPKAAPQAATPVNEGPPALPPGAKAGPLDLSKIGPHDETYAHENLDPDAWASVALMYQSKGELGQALTTLDRAIAHYPQSAHLYAVRGALWLQQKEYAKALADLKRSLELAEDPGVRVNYAEALLRFDRKKEALASLNKVLAAHPDYLPALFNRGVLRYQMGNEEGALADFDRAIELDPQAAAPYFNRAAVRWALGRKREAIADLDAFIERAPVGEWKQTAQDLRATWKAQLEEGR